MHWAEKAQWKKSWEEEVFYAWQSVKQEYRDILDRLPYKRSIINIYVFSIKSQDEDNAYGSMKGIIDGVVKVRIIEDDTIDVLKTNIIHVPVRTRDAEHIELTIESRK